MATYLLGRPFIVRTDKTSLEYLLDQMITTPTQIRWLTMILGYDYEIQYKKGTKNQGADALSRIAEFQFQAISTPKVDWWAIVQEEVKLDPFFNKLISTMTPMGSVVLRDEVWIQNGKVLLSPNSSLITCVLKDNHSSPVGSHFGFSKTLHRIKSNFNWPGMSTTVKNFIRECDVCQRCQTECVRPAGLLQSLSLSERSWSEISMDFIEGLPLSHRYSVIMVLVDRLSKYAHFIQLKHPYSALTIAKVFVDQVVRLLGVHKSIVSDRGKVFVSAFWQKLFQLQGTNLCMSSNYHPHSDEQTKVVNKTLEQYLRCFTHDRPKQWVEWFAWAEYSYNTTTHQGLEDKLRTRDTILAELRHNLEIARNRMKV
ncbi:hypothetical protein ACOSQ3_023408 [Xanthoceras sorbifolium]